MIRNSRVVLCVLLALLVYEAAALVTHRFPTITALVVTYVPEEVTLGLLCWLLIHFAIRYRRKGD